MREPDTLSRFVLCTRAAEKVKDSLMIFRVDAATVIDDLEDGEAEFCPAPDSQIAGYAGLEVFQGVVDQVREDLLERKAVADDVGQWLDMDLGVGLCGLMRHGGNDTLD